MELTFIGALQCAIGLAIVLTGSLRSIFAFLVGSSLFGGSASILLPALGGSSIPPAEFALVFVYLRILAPHGGYSYALPGALRANLWLVLFTAYGIAISYLGPRIFANAMDVAPMRPVESSDLFETLPLAPTAQNFTSAFYMFGTLLVALSSFILTRHSRNGMATLVSCAIAIGWAHLFLGCAVVAATGTPLADFFELFRNGGYAQLNQSFQGFVRIRGLFPEASGYAEYGFAWFVINAELWYRSIRPRATGPVALGLAMVLVFSTSSTAYFGLGAYTVWFLLRPMLVRSARSGVRLAQFAAAAMGICVIVSILLMVMPELPLRFIDMVQAMTLEKSASESGQQRFFWALQGWDAFKFSYGIGIGPGSFRSSSFFFAVMGSTGVIGLASLALYLLRVLQPTRRSTYGRAATIELTVGGAFGTAAILSQIPALVSSPTADLGTNFAILAGAAVGLRPSLWRSTPESQKTGTSPPLLLASSLEAPQEC
jgi:hypothetical protein